MHPNMTPNGLDVCRLGGIILSVTQDIVSCIMSDCRTRDIIKIS